MRIAILADIHGNIHALREVLKDIETRDIDEIIIGGDVVNMLPFAREVLDTIYENEWRMVIGNHEEYMLHCNSPAEHNLFPELWRSLFWSYEQMTPDDLDFIRNLPVSLEIEDMLILHGAPSILRFGIIPSTPDEVIEKMYGEITHNVIITAHTHVPFVMNWRDKTFVNPGSVGAPFDGIKMASYVIATNKEQRWTFEHIRVPFDIEAVIRASDEAGYLDTDIYAQAAMQQLREARPLMRTVMHMIDGLVEDLGISMEEALAQATLENISGSRTYNLLRKDG